jgi:catechol 2,3-dioxygenase-like lactoylglutathione lyase family enzyme
MRLLLTGAVALLFALPAQAQLAPPNSAGVTFAHVHLNVTDVDAHTRIWVEQFGGVAVQKGFLRTVRFPNMLVVFNQAEPTGGSQGSVMDHFGFKVRNMAEVLASWRAAGLEVQSEFTGAEGYKNAYVMAPDGVRFELQEDPQLPMKAAGYHIHFFTPDYLELMDWYVDVFGGVKAPRGNIETTVNVPGQNLSFANSQTERAPTQGRAIDHIGFEVDDLEAFVQRLEGLGVEFQRGYTPVASIELAIAFFTDPSGVYVELTEGFDEY